jgi:hypothetical protein
VEMKSLAISVKIYVHLYKIKSQQDTSFITV